MLQLRSSFPALRHRNFRLLWIGQLISTSGSMMQNAAVLWHVSLLASPEHAPSALALVGVFKFVPILVFSLIGGVVADALDRRRLMLITQSLMALIAGVLAVLTFRGLGSLFPIYVLTALSSAAGVFDGPARQSLVPALVPMHDFPNAISLNTIMFQVASVLGPMLAGMTMLYLDIGWVYLFNALSFVAVIVSLLAMRGVPERAAGMRTEISLGSALEGLRFVFHAPMIRSTMLLDFFATFFSSATALLPIFAQRILFVDARGYGVLSSAASIGAVLASLVLIRHFDKIERRGSVLLWAVGGVRPGDGRVRLLDELRLDVRVSRADRCRRHGQHGAAQHHPPDRNTRSPARKDDEHQHDLLPRRPAARRVRGGLGRAGIRRTVLGRQRWDRLLDRNGLDRDEDAGVAALSTRRCRRCDRLINS